MFLLIAVTSGPRCVPVTTIASVLPKAYFSSFQTDWELFAAASATSPKTRDLFVNLVVKYLEAGHVDAAFPEYVLRRFSPTYSPDTHARPSRSLYETKNAQFPGREGKDWNIEFIARPVVGLVSRLQFLCPSTVADPPASFSRSGHFSLLALEKANKANGVKRDPFDGKPSFEGGLRDRLGFVDQSAATGQITFGRERM